MAKRKSSLPATAANPKAPDTERRFGTEVVPVDAVYHVAKVHPSTPGPWSGEAEKVAWTDGNTGYGCIIRRSSRGGHLGGFVGVGPDHPLHGFTEPALEGLGLRVHGGVSHAEGCQHWQSEATSVCHVRVQAGSARRNGTDVFANDASKAHDLWWFGFECNGPGDVLPGGSARSRPDTLDGVNERAYRSEEYVFQHTVWLAEQLRCVELGGSPTDAVPPPSEVIGYDPHKKEA